MFCAELPPRNFWGWYVLPLLVGLLARGDMAEDGCLPNPAHALFVQTRAGVAANSSNGRRLWPSIWLLPRGPSAGDLEEELHDHSANEDSSRVQLLVGRGLDIPLLEAVEAPAEVAGRGQGAAEQTETRVPLRNVGVGLCSTSTPDLLALMMLQQVAAAGGGFGYSDGAEFHSVHTRSALQNGYINVHAVSIGWTEIAQSVADEVEGWNQTDWSIVGWGHHQRLNMSPWLPQNITMNPMHEYLISAAEGSEVNPDAEWAARASGLSLSRVPPPGRVP